MKKSLEESDCLWTKRFLGRKSLRIKRCDYRDFLFTKNTWKWMLRPIRLRVQRFPFEIQPQTFPFQTTSNRQQPQTNILLPKTFFNPIWISNSIGIQFTAKYSIFKIRGEKYNHPPSEEKGTKLNRKIPKAQ